MRDLVLHLVGRRALRARPARAASPDRRPPARGPLPGPSPGGRRSRRRRRRAGRPGVVARGDGADRRVRRARPRPRGRLPPPGRVGPGDARHADLRAVDPRRRHPPGRRAAAQRARRRPPGAHVHRADRVARHRHGPRRDHAAGPHRPHRSHRPWRRAGRSTSPCRPATIPGPPDLTIEASALDLCRLASNRLAVDQIDVRVDGDRSLLEPVLVGASAFAMDWIIRAVAGARSRRMHKGMESERGSSLVPPSIASGDSGCFRLQLVEELVGEQLRPGGYRLARSIRSAALKRRCPSAEDPRPPDDRLEG